MDLHPLDLPSLSSRPPFETLDHLLSSLTIEIRNFDEAPALPPALLNWLVKLISAELEWLPEENADILREKAASRVAQSCASSNKTRTIEIGALSFKLHEPGLVNDNIGHKTWGSCLVMAKRLLNEPELLVGNVLELGSGTGLVGMVAAYLGHPAVLTDLPCIMENLQKNIELNESLLKASCVSKVLDWSEPYAVPNMDTILISDPVYSSAAPAQIEATLKVLQIERVLLQLPIRAKFEDLRNDLYERFQRGYTREVYIEEDSFDDYGPSRYAFSVWKKLS